MSCAHSHVISKQEMHLSGRAGALCLFPHLPPGVCLRRGVRSGADRGVLVLVPVSEEEPLPVTAECDVGRGFVVSFMTSATLR